MIVFESIGTNMSRRFYRSESNADLLSYLDRGQSACKENRWTFEVAWEAANKGFNYILIEVYIK